MLGDGVTLETDGRFRRAQTQRDRPTARHHQRKYPGREKQRPLVSTGWLLPDTLSR